MGKDRNLTQSQRNALYRQAKELKREIKDNICTRQETQVPSRENVRKFIGTDVRMKRKIKYFKDCLKAQGADKKDYDVEKLRR